jgi:ubiquinone biosynthesis protein COQ9
MGYSPAFAGIVTKGEADLVKHFTEQNNKDFAHKLTALGPEFQRQRHTDSIRQAMRIRLEMNTRFIGVLPLTVCADIHGAPGTCCCLVCA